MSADVNGNVGDVRLLRSDLPAEPLALFEQWFADAASGDEPEAMTLATLDDDGMPDARTVLLRGLELRPGREGFVFYTNYASAKGRGLALHPACALLFYWGDLGGKSRFGGRQVRVRGLAERVPEATSDAYFAARPRLSQLGAWASPQSEVVTEAALEAEVAQVSARFAGQPVPRPPHWGGFVVVAQSIEFWQGRPGRLHDRFRYVRDAREAGGWRIERLAP